MTPLGNIRLAGINEHFERVKFFMENAATCKDPITQFRFQMAAIYSCRAIIELMLEAADKQEVKMSRNDLEVLIAPQTPYYYLIERIRIHDFHRFGLLLPHPKYKVTKILGPLKLKSQKGGINVQLVDTGLETTLSGKSKVEFQRPLIIEDAKIFDDESKKYVSLEEILDKFTSEMPKVLDQFKALLTSTDKVTNEVK